MTQVEPDFKPVPGETAEQKRDRLAAKREHQRKKEEARVAAIHAEREANRVEREKYMKPLLFDLLLKAKEYGVDADVCLQDPDRDWTKVPGVKFTFGYHDTTYLTVDAEQWEVDSVLAQFKAMDDAKAEELRQEALRASGRAKLLSVLEPEELQALGLAR